MVYIHARSHMYALAHNDVSTFLFPNLIQENLQATPAKSTRYTTLTSKSKYGYNAHKDTSEARVK